MSIATKVQRLLHVTASGPSWFESLSPEQQEAYRKLHPNSKLIHSPDTPSDHTKHPYNKILAKHGFQHTESVVRGNENSPQLKKHAYTQHSYTNGKDKVHIWDYHNESKPVWHGRHVQKNGIIAPASHDTKPSLDRWIERHKTED